MKSRFVGHCVVLWTFLKYVWRKKILLKLEIYFHLFIHLFFGKSYKIIEFGIGQKSKAKFFHDLFYVHNPSTFVLYNEK